MESQPFGDVAQPSRDNDPWGPPESPTIQQSAPRQSYPPGYYPYVAPFVDPNAPGTVFLDIPGAAAPIYIVDADGGHPQFYIGAGKATAGAFSGSTIAVPLLDGTHARVKWVESWTGFPVATYQGRTIFSLPTPPGADRFVIVLVQLFPLVLGLIPGYFLGIALARWMAGMIKRGESTAKRRIVPLAIALSPVVFLALCIALTNLA